MRYGRMRRVLGLGGAVLVLGVLSGPAAQAAPAGTVVAWGDNADGQLGNGTFTAHSTAQAVHDLAGVKQLRGGREHVIALRTNGTVWAWGHNNYGQVGDGTTTNRNVPVQVSGLTDVKQISTGHYHSMCVDQRHPGG